MMSTFSSTDDKTIERNEALNATNALTGWGQFWAILRMSFWRNKNIAIVATIMMLVALPLITVIAASSLAENGLGQYFSQELYLLIRQLMFYCILPISTIIMILGASQMLSFLHQRPALDVYHALPIKRRCMFFGRFAAGFLLVLIPQLIAAAVTCLLVLLPSFALLDVGQILLMVLMINLMSLVFYAISCLSFVLTGTFLDALFMLLLLNIAYPATFYTVGTFVSMTLPGFMISSGSDFNQLFLLSPLGMLFAAPGSPMDLMHILWWVVLAVLLTLGSLLIYQWRKSELAGASYAYRMPFYMLRFLASVIIGLIFGYLFELQYGTLLSYILGALIGSLFIHVLIETILSRGFSGLLKSIKSYLIFILIFAIGCISVSTGFFGFDTRIAAQDQIAQIELYGTYLDVSYNADMTINYLSFSESENKTIILDIHQAWLKEMQTLVNKPYTMDTQRALQASSTRNGKYPTQIIYKMKSGFTMNRTIYLDYAKEPYVSLIKELQNSEEYKMQKYAEFFGTTKTHFGMNFKTKTGQIIFSLDNRKDNEVLTQIGVGLEKDLILNSEGKNYSKILGYLTTQMINENGSVFYSSDQPSIQLTDAFSNTINILTEYNLIAKVNTLAEKYTSVYIVLNEGKSNQLMSIKQTFPSGEYNIDFKYFVDANNYEPRLNNKEVFLKIDNPILAKTMYDVGQKNWRFGELGYFIFLAEANQVNVNGLTNSELPVLFVPADQMPPEVTALINK